MINTVKCSKSYDELLWETLGYGGLLDEVFIFENGNTTKKEHFEKLVSFGCVICGKPAEIHHCGFNKMMGKRASDFETIPLCPDHHRNGGYGVAIHAGKKTWEDVFGFERVLWVNVMTKIYGEKELWPHE